MKPVPEPESTPFAAAPHRRNLTPEEAQAAYDAAPAVPLSEERIKEMVDYAVRRTEMPRQDWPRAAAEEIHDALDAIEQAAGEAATAEQDNHAGFPVFIDAVERIIRKHCGLICEHGVKDGDYCEDC